MQVLTIANQKGGVAKTTISANLAGGICRKYPKSKILLIDIDPQSNLTYHFLPRKNIEKNVSQLFKNEVYNQSDIIYRTRFENIDIIPSTIELSPTELIAGTIVDAHRRLDRYLQTIRNAYDLAIIDTPPSLGFFSMNAIMCANYLLIPSVPEKLSVSGIVDLLKTIKVVRDITGKNVSVLGIMPVMVDRRYRSHNQILEEMAENFGDMYREDFMLNTNAPLKDSTARAKLIYEYDIRATSYKQFLKIAELVYKEVVLQEGREAVVADSSTVQNAKQQ